MNRALQILVVSFVVAICSCEIQQTAQSETENVSAASSVNLRHSEVKEIPKMAPVNPEDLMKNVAKRYSRLESYAFHGSRHQVSTLDGKNEKRYDSEFQVEYHRDGGSFIQWNEKGVNKLLRINGDKAWLEIDGARSESFSSARDGIDSVSRGSEGLTRFYFKVFLFQRELSMPTVFFAGLLNPQVIDQRQIDGRDCYLLSGTFERVEARMTYWIDTENFLIRRIEREIVVRKSEGPYPYLATTGITETYSDIEFR